MRPFALLYIPVTLRTAFGARPARLVLGLQQHSLQVTHLDGVRDLLPTSQRAVSLGVMTTKVELDPGICKIKHNNHGNWQLLAGLHMLAALWPELFNFLFVLLWFVLINGDCNCAILPLENILKSGTIRCF